MGFESFGIHEWKKDEDGTMKEKWDAKNKKMECKIVQSNA